MYMTTPRFTQRQIRTGRNDLANLINKIQNAAQTDKGTQMQAVSDVGSASLPHIRASNLDALIITAQDCGYVANILLKKVSPLQDDMFGSPDHMPFPTRADAIAWAQMVVESLVSIETAAKA